MSTKTTKKERHNPLRVMGNMFFLFRYLFRYTPMAMVWCVINAVLNSEKNIALVIITKINLL